jgi:hypothetical protein
VVAAELLEGTDVFGPGHAQSTTPQDSAFLPNRPIFGELPLHPKIPATVAL